MPRIDDIPAVPDEATQWRAAYEVDSRATTWVANHPPLHYAAAAPLIWLADLLNRPDGGLLYMRLANLAAAAIGVTFTYLLARRTSGSPSCAVLAAGLVALLPQGHEQFSLALNDGSAFASAAAVTWAAVWCIQHDYSDRGLLMLGLTTAACAGTRAATMLVAVGMVALVAFVWARTLPTGRSRIGCVGRVALIGLGPAFVLFGWFYVNNMLEYGDFAGSEHLIGRLNRTSPGLIEVLTSGTLWADLYEGLFSPLVTRVFGRRQAGVDAIADIVLVVALIGVALVAVQQVRPTGRTSAALPAVHRLALGVNGLAVAIVMATTASFIAAGGSAFQRYLLPAMPALATLVAIGLHRIGARWLPLLVISLLMFRVWHLLPTEGFLSALSARMPVGLREPVAGPLSRDIARVAGVAGATALFGTLVVYAVRRVETGAAPSLTDAQRPGEPND